MSNVLEYVAAGLGVIAGAAGGISWVHRRGVKRGMDSACELRIKEDIRGVKAEVVDMKVQGDKEHKEIKGEIQTIHSKIDKVQGSQDIIQDLIKHSLSKTD